MIVPAGTAGIITKFFVGTASYKCAASQAKPSFYFHHFSIV
jgi:hypothetical protein